jgi:hypothetical protein
MEGRGGQRGPSSAMVEALSVYGIAHIEMPATAASVWAAIRAAQERPA